MFVVVLSMLLPVAIKGGSVPAHALSLRSHDDLS
jgi:hypothetical protein